MINENILKESIDKTIFVSGNDVKLNGNYVNVTLGNTLKCYDTPLLDIKDTNNYKVIQIPEEGLLLEPNKLYLGSTNEYTKTYGFVPLLSGLSSLAILGLEIHVTAGFGDNGFEGTWTLEIVCTNPTLVYPNMEIGRLCYYPVVGDDGILYNGKYIGQIEPTISRIETEYGAKLIRRIK